MGTRHRLHVLQRRIIRKIPNRYFFFTPEDGIKGFDGEGPLVVIGFRPSTDDWKADAPSRRLFYDTLKANGVGDAHLTDCIKEKALTKNAKTDYDLAWNVDVLTEEFEIIKPDGIIALGRDAEEFLYDNDFARRHSIMGVYHFGRARWGYEREFEDDFAAGVRLYREWQRRSGPVDWGRLPDETKRQESLPGVTAGSSVRGVMPEKYSRESQARSPILESCPEYLF